MFLAGEEVTGLPAHEIASRGVGIKTQVPSVMDGLTARENIWLSARRRLDRVQAGRKTEETIARLGLDAIAAEPLAQLAHGQRQQVELGMVAAGDPWLILLDEPAAGMSAQGVERITALIRDMNSNAAIVIVEHDMQFIRSLASQVTVFHRGAVLMEDHVDSVMVDPTVRNIYLGNGAPASNPQTAHPRARERQPPWLASAALVWKDCPGAMAASRFCTTSALMSAKAKSSAFSAITAWESRPC